ncbi:MAG: Mg2 transporter protein CorA family protein [Clostridia bacterium]|jgi:magnesium transporter|nr:Mg2 transporter protein CorA family protein [Clostridia bacterium]
MMEIFKTVGDKLTRADSIESGVWVNLVNPKDEEVTAVCNAIKLECDYLKAALDEEESSRLEVDEGVTLIIVDIPMLNEDVSPVSYSTIPLGIVLAGDSIVTVCLKESAIIRDFIENRVKTFYTFKKTRFILQILYKNAIRYLQYLKQIDKESSRIENELHKSMKNKELIQLLALEKSLVYFSTSLKANELVLEKLLRQESIKNYPEDAELLEDVIVENKQAIEMAKIYSDILSGTMDAFASVISNNLNIVMKFLASVTIVMAIPTMIASFFGMNVLVPMQSNPYAFLYILGASFLFCVIAAVAMAKRKMF